MKILKIILLHFLLVFCFSSCEKNSENRWKVNLKSPVEVVKIDNISTAFYDTKIPIDAFKKRYPWFQGTVPDVDFEKRRTDSLELKIYKEAKAKINEAKLSEDLGQLFAHIKYHFPNFKNPKVFLFSSALQMVQDPILYDEATQFLFIDISGFMGYKNENYKGLELYFQTSMNPENIVPKVAKVFAEQTVPYTGNSQKFIDLMVYHGKITTLLDAFLPTTPEYLKLDLTKKQYDWTVANEVNIYNYFVENSLIFGDDHRLVDRFINPGPFSKFYTQIDNESSPMVGVFIGWKICKAYLDTHPDVKPIDFMKMEASGIFNESGYSPKE